MSDDPKLIEGLVWSGCPHARRDEEHWPCRDCKWRVEPKKKTDDSG